MGTIYLWANGTDTTNLTMAWLATNETGAWKNWTDKSNSFYTSPIIVNNSVNTPFTANFTWSNSTINGSIVVQWRIYFNDSSGNINQTDIYTFTILPTISISLPVSSLGFGSLSPDISDNTTDDVPPAFRLRNDGNVNTNVTIESTNLFSSQANPTQFYQFNSNLSESNSIVNITFDIISTFTNMFAGGSPGRVVSNLKFEDVNDEIRTHINVTVPTTESAGQKSSEVTFTGSQA